jgi:hypothetical protein
VADDPQDELPLRLGQRDDFEVPVREVGLLGQHGLGSLDVDPVCGGLPHDRSDGYPGPTAVSASRNLKVFKGRGRGL